MNRSSVIGLSLALFALPMAAGALELDDLIARNIEARGGLERIQAVQTMRMEGTMMMGPMQAPFQIELMRPNSVRFEMEFQGMRMVQAFDGENGWQIMPFMGKPDPEAMSGEDLDNIREQGDMLDGPLVDWKSKGYTVELLGQDEIEGSEVWKISVTRENGRQDLVFLDGEYFLELRTQSQRPMGGQPMQVTTDIGDYKDIDGLVLPHSIQVSLPGAPGAQSMRIGSVELNADIDASRFAMPGN